jgi:hypothetical protein
MPAFYLIETPRTASDAGAPRIPVFLGGDILEYRYFSLDITRHLGAKWPPSTKTLVDPRDGYSPGGSMKRLGLGVLFSCLVLFLAPNVVAHETNGIV